MCVFVFSELQLPYFFWLRAFRVERDNQGTAAEMWVSKRCPPGMSCLIHLKKNIPASHITMCNACLIKHLQQILLFKPMTKTPSHIPIWHVFDIHWHLDTIYLPLCLQGVKTPSLTSMELQMLTSSCLKLQTVHNIPLSLNKEGRLLLFVPKCRVYLCIRNKIITKTALN